jgi:hypothetical protein
MTNPKANKSTEEKKQAQFYYEEDLFIFKKEGIPEIESDGSASAFDETERVSEDNFDDLSEK